MPADFPEPTYITTNGIRMAVYEAGPKDGPPVVLAHGWPELAYAWRHQLKALGEAARTEADARRYHLSYSKAITAIAAAATTGDIRTNPGISVKLSALHPRYEVAKRARVMEELVPRVRALAGLAKAAGLGFNIDAEEADRLALSLKLLGPRPSSPASSGRWP